MIGLLAAAAMVGSFFLPWLSILGEDLIPYDMIGDQIPLSDLPWRGLVFLSSFALAALAIVLLVIQRAAGIVMVIAGAIPFALIAESVFGVREQAQDLGLPLPDGGNLLEVGQRMREFIDMGLPVYLVAAAVMVLVGLARTVRGR